MEFSEENQQLLEEKIARLEKALILETRADERLRLEHEIKDLKENPTNFISILPPKTHKNQYIIIGFFVLLVIILAMWALKKPTPIEQPKQVEETPTTVIQNPTNHGIAIQGNGTINIHQNNPKGETK